MAAQKSARPEPDPTAITTERLRQLSSDLEKLFGIQFSTSMREMERIQKLVDAVPDLIKVDIEHVKEVFGEKFAGVGVQFTMRDIALAAAFKAAEALSVGQNLSNTIASDKAAIAFTKEIDNAKSRIDDLKERISELAGKNWATVGAYIVGAIGIAALVVSAMIRR